MSAEISVSQGIVEAMYANDPAWHGLGTIFDKDGTGAPDSDTAITLSHLDWPVELEPVFVRGNLVPDFKATVRQDTGLVLGIVGNRYVVQQNRESFNFLDSLLQDGIMRYESAMALKGGREVCLLARLPKADLVAEGDAMLRYIMFSTSHDGTGSIRAIPTSVRVVCANTKRLAIEKAKSKLIGVSIRHTGDLSERLNIVRQYLSQFDESFTLFRDKAGALASKRFTRDEKLAFLNELFPQPVKEGKLQTTGKGHTIWQKKRDMLDACLADPSNNLPAIQGTWWSLYNAISEAVDHKGRYNGANKAENRYTSVIDGNGANLKDKAFDLALTMAA